MAVVEETRPDRRSLEEVHGSIDVPDSGGRWQRLRRLFAFLGPAYLVSVGYMDPGNWATDLEGGARFGYALIWVLLMSNLMAVLLQTLAARLGVVTGHDLAQACRAEYSPRVNVVLWLLAEVAIAATDLAEVLGTIIALKLLFGMPLLWGCLVTAFDTFLLLWLQRWGMRKMEAVILALVATIGACFLVQIFHGPARPGGGGRGVAAEPAAGRRCSSRSASSGATVMPHNLYLHSALVQSRRIGTDAASKATGLPVQPDRLGDRAERGVLRQRGDPGPERRGLPPQRRGGGEHRGGAQAAALVPRARRRRSCSAIALLCAGQSSTLTGTLAGQIVMEGYLHLQDRPLAAPAGHPAARPDPGGAGDRADGRGVDAAAAGPEPGDPQPAALVRGDPADPLHLEPAEHGGVRHALVGPGAGLADGGDHRRPNGKLVLDQIVDWVDAGRRDRA